MASMNRKLKLFYRPKTKLQEGNVLHLSVSHSVHGGGACMAGGAWWGRHVWQEGMVGVACMAGAVHGRGHVLQGNMCGRGWARMAGGGGHVWQGWACMAGGMRGRGDMHGRGVHFRPVPTIRGNANDFMCKLASSRVFIKVWEPHRKYTLISCCVFVNECE